MSDMQELLNILDKELGIKDIYFKGEKKFYKKDFTTPITPGDLPRPDLNDILLELAIAFSDPDSEGVVTDVTLVESGSSVTTKTVMTVIWCDLREQAIKQRHRDFQNFTYYCEDGQISLIHVGMKIILDPNKYYGVTPEKVAIKKTIVFADEKSNTPKYIDVPLKTKYLSLIDEAATTTAPTYKQEGIGRYLEYTIKLKGRNRANKFLIPIIQSVQDAIKGTILLWPNFQKSGWNAYFMYYDLEDHQKTLSFSPVLLNKALGRSMFKVLPPLLYGQANAITWDRDNPRSGADESADKSEFLKWTNWGKGHPRYLLVKEKTDGTNANEDKELGLFAILLEEGTVAEGRESWGIDFGTQGSIVAFAPTVDNPVPFYLRKDFSYMILERDREIQENIKNNARWLPTYPEKIDAGSEPYVLTQLSVDKKESIQTIYNRGRTCPVEHYNIVALDADTDSISERLITDLKWPGAITSSETEFAGRREARKGYLALLIIMALAERINYDPQHNPAVKNIIPIASYPLRMGTLDVKAYRSDLSDVYTWVSYATGFTFTAQKTISESMAASLIADETKETVIADLGGGTLDLWIGKGSNSANYEISTDSVRLGGISLLREISKSSFIQRQFGKSDELGRQLGKLYLQKSFDYVGEHISQKWSQLTIMYTYYSYLINEYIARFIVGHLKKNYSSDGIQVDFIVVGNGWKLFSCFHRRMTALCDWIVNDIKGRVDRLVKEASLSLSVDIGVIGYHEKKDVAVGAAKSYQRSLSEGDEEIKTTAGIDFKFPDTTDAIKDADWTSRVPFKFSDGAKHGKAHIHISAKTLNQSYIIPPEIPKWSDKVTQDVFRDFNGEIISASDSRLYRSVGTELLLQVSPFSVLCEKILNSFRNRDSW